jgi:hypothetical protein
VRQPFLFILKSNNMRYCLLYIFLVLSFSCARQPEDTAEAEFEEVNSISASEKNTAMTLKPEQLQNPLAKLNKTANYRFEAKDISECTDAIEQAVLKYPAYISSSDLHQTRDALENKITIRVQSDYFNDILKDIDRLPSHIDFRNVSTDDVSKQFVDLESRLKTKREVEQRYMNILRHNAGTVEELLDAEKQIGALHEEIEATVSQIRYLSGKVEYSTINLAFYQTLPPMVANERTIGGRFREAMSSGLQGLIAFLVVIAYLWPAVLASGFGLLIFRLRKSRVLARNLPEN